MDQKIIKSDGRYFLFEHAEMHTKFQPGNYIFNFDAKANMWLSDGKAFTVPEHMYDLEKEFRETIKNTFHELNKNLGIVLEGYKGMGKSVNAKLLCIEMGLPVIMITQQIPLAVNFISYIQDIKQDCIIFVDEFEKIFPRKGNGDDDYHTEQSFLSIMDGALSSKYKRLFLFTTNNEVGDFFINRPSRVRYYKKYEFIREELYEMIIADKLENKEFEQDLKDNLSLSECSIDLLTTIIEEINIQKKPYSSFKEYFNHKPRKVQYEKFILNEKKEWEFKGLVEEDREITRKTTYVDGIYGYVSDVIKDDIFFKATEYTEDDEDDERKRVAVIYKFSKRARPSLSVMV